MPLSFSGKNPDSQATEWQQDVAMGVSPLELIYQPTEVLKGRQDNLRTDFMPPFWGFSIASVYRSMGFTGLTGFTHGYIMTSFQDPRVCQ